MEPCGRDMRPIVMRRVFVTNVCTGCGEEFTYERPEGTRGRIRTTCRREMCRRARQPSTTSEREHERYEARGYDRPRARDRARKCRQDALDLLGGCCVRCGERDPVVLQFDHIDCDGKFEKSRANIWQVVLRDPYRFQILCANDHARKTYADRQAGRIPSGSKDWSIWKLTDYEISLL